MNPLISIITPTYNAEMHIEGCILSVVRQIFSNHEHIVLDGNSNDMTVAMCTTAGVKLITGRAKGIYEKMNDGILAAKGEWIYFMGADDRFRSCGTLTIIAGYLRTAKEDIVYGDVFSERLGGNYDGKFGNVKLMTRNICHQAIFYRRSVFEKMGNHNLRYTLCADYDFNLRCWLSGKIKHRHVPVMIANYADEGVSSLKRDVAFERDYPGLVWKYNRGNIFKRMYIIVRLLPKIINRCFKLDASYSNLINKEHGLQNKR